MKWALGDGQEYWKDLGYAPPPESFVKNELDALVKIQLRGRCD